MKMSNSSGDVFGIAIPSDCAIRPQFGSPPCSAALTSGEFATARATPSTTASDPPRTTTRPIRLEPSPSRTMSSASLRSAQSSASPKRTASSVSASTRTPDAPDACRITVSLVESCPSTEIRSNDRSTHRPSSRSANAGVQSRVGLDEAEHRREGRRDHPRALGLRGQPHRAGGQRDVDLDLLRELVRRPDRLGEVAVPVLAQVPARAGDAADDVAAVQQHADHAGRGDRDLVLAHAAGHARRRPGSARPPRSRGCRSPRSRCRSWRRSRGSRPGGVRSLHSTTGAASTPDFVNRAAETQSGRRADHQADVHPAARLQARRHARGLEPSRQVAGVLGHVPRQLQPAELIADPPSPAARTSG